MDGRMTAGWWVTDEWMDGDLTNIAVEVAGPAPVAESGYPSAILSALWSSSQCLAFIQGIRSISEMSKGNAGLGWPRAQGKKHA